MQDRPTRFAPEYKELLRSKNGESALIKPALSTLSTGDCTLDLYMIRLLSLVTDVNELPIVEDRK